MKHPYRSVAFIAVASAVLLSGANSIAKRQKVNAEIASFSGQINTLLSDLEIGGVGTIILQLHSADTLVYVTPYISEQEFQSHFCRRLSRALYRAIGMTDRKAPAFFWTANGKILLRTQRIYTSRISISGLYWWKGVDHVRILVEKRESDTGFQYLEVLQE